MSNYTGLIPFAGLLLGAALSNAVAAEDASAPVADAPAALQASPAPADEATTPEPATAAATSAAPTIKSGAPLRYVVKKGDTLWGIAGYFLQNPWQWPEIWYSNDQIKNPHLIYPGNVLKLIMIGGRPRLVVEGGTANEEPAPNGPLKLSPKVRSDALAAAIPTIPLQTIRDFLNAPRMIAEDELDKTPVVLEFTDNHIVGGADTDVFVKGIEPDGRTDYKVVRKGDAYRDPDNGKIVGYEAVPVGNGEVKHVDAKKKIALFTITDATHEARIGDRLVPIDTLADYDAYFYPRAPEKAITGRIISVFDGASQIGQYQIVSLNRGLDDGLAAGHVLTVMQAGRTARDPDAWFGGSIQLPDTEAGTVMVIKALPHFSYALVMKATRAIHAADKVITPP